MTFIEEYAHEPNKEVRLELYTKVFVKHSRTWKSFSKRFLGTTSQDFTQELYLRGYRAIEALYAKDGLQGLNIQGIMFFPAKSLGREMRQDSNRHGVALPVDQPSCEPEKAHENMFGRTLDLCMSCDMEYGRDFHAVYIEETKTQAQVAKEHGVSRGRVSDRFNKIKKKFRRLLGER